MILMIGPVVSNLSGEVFKKYTHIYLRGVACEEGR